MKICINGFGRIGRAFFRILWNREDFECVNINEPYATIEDIVYFLKYDSLYGCFEANTEIINNDTLKISNDKRLLYTHISHFSEIIELDSLLDSDVYIVESSGNSRNIEYYKNHINRKAIFTFSSSQIESEFILGVNTESLAMNKSNFISGSICDTVAIAPVLKAIYDNEKISQTFITTMHPALNYQKVIDNYPTQGINRSLGRQYIDSIIPKRTSAENVLKKFYCDKKIRCMSYRIPTKAVCAADITVIAQDSIDMNNILNTLEKDEGICFCNDDLVSIDFKSSSAAATVDMRWTEVINQTVFKTTIWYDNEYGYSSRVIELLKRWNELTKDGMC